MTDANGLYQMRARYYHPELKRFVNRDIVRGTIDQSQTLNRFAYVNGNPISYIDPFGLSRDGDSPWIQGGDFLVDTMPGIGTAKGFQQAFSGYNHITGEKLSTAERWAEGVGATASFIPIPGMKHAGKYVTEGVFWAGNKIKNFFGWGSKKVDDVACNCFTAGTKVQTDEGEKPIEDIQVGDMVLAKSDETGEVAYKEVVGLFQKQSDEIYYVHVGDEVIEATAEHPFWLDGKGWTEVKDLKVGDLLVTSDGSKLSIDKIEKEPRVTTVYNFEVADFQSYFVSNLGIWVHNCAVNSVTRLLNNMPEFTGSNREKLLSTVQSVDLRGFINELYRPGAKVGDGGTAAILTKELYEGSSTHLQKAQDQLRGLNKLTKSGNLSLNDLDILDAIADDLEKAIRLFK